MRLLKIIACTMVQKHSRRTVGKMFNTTYYCSNPRKAASLGSYVYHKTVNDAEFVRIECRYKRPFFKKLKITRMEDAGTINPQVIFSKLDFKLFNVKRFLKKLLRLQALSEGDEKSKALAIEDYFFKNFNEPQGDGILSASIMLQ